ncbi:uncharacterized protein LOC124446087 isoform X3 [Xenia sp. Carnegie-2017]|uniref:uncharacterized protein LOC124446087 isoform X3 n=1 Tax=Xenia sp. Carnegie-2017 TaxID=2897299 RepID=UPI001F036DBA|nr:uncharacterized protein LOC124446087 isoform X3 [Xenia sp. Carnegie-2017]
MPLLHQKIRRRIFCNDQSANSCDLRKGLYVFINSRTDCILSNIGLKLDKNIVLIDLPIDVPMLQDSSSSKCSGDSSHDQTDGPDSEPPTSLYNGVTVKKAEPQSFAQGFGLRNNDVIISINDNKITTVDNAGLIISKIVKSTNDARLRMQIARREEESIKVINLDNGGEEMSSHDSLLLFAEDNFKLKNLKFRRFLVATGNGLRLSNFWTTSKEKCFKVRLYYLRNYEDGETRFVTLQHIHTGKYIKSSQNAFALESSPNLHLSDLRYDSPFLFIVKRWNLDTNYEYLQPVNFNDDNHQAFGFERRKHPPTLLYCDDHGCMFRFYKK